tara:strand:+ start:106 stop:537 length:432 start_codon:yes stop_codon:yes gene_type:complete
MINKNIKSLSRKSKKWKGDSSSLMRLLNKMRVAMINNNGVGIAAVQIGVHTRVCIVLEEAIINPVISQKSMFTTKFVEGCLSLPDLSIKTERSKKITIKYFNENGQPKQKRFEGFSAIVLQHELDHLNGKTILDRGKLVCNLS